MSRKGKLVQVKALVTSGTNICDAPSLKIDRDQDKSAAMDRVFIAAACALIPPLLLVGASYGMSYLAEFPGGWYFILAIVVIMVFPSLMLWRRRRSVQP